jgi:hypothetical protein
MGDMQDISLVELVREGAGMVVLANHEGEEKLIFLSPNVFLNEGRPCLDVFFILVFFLSCTLVGSLMLFWGGYQVKFF